MHGPCYVSRTVLLLAAALVGTAATSGCQSWCESSAECDKDEVCVFVEGGCLQPAQLGLCQKRPDNCSSVVEAVCGCDGVTYKNGCEAGRAGTSVASRGACRCGPGLPECQMGDFCQRTACGDNGSGTCVRPGQSCLPGNAVCGCDGKTYVNACEAANALVSLAGQTACEGDPLPDMTVPPDFAGTDAGPPKPTILISEFRTSGPAGFGDEFVELYNTTDKTIVLDATWRMLHSSVQNVDCAGQWIRYIGTGQEIPPHGHLLLGGWNYTQMPQRDQLLLNSNIDYSLGDAGALVLQKGGVAVDTVCYAYDAITTARLKKHKCDNEIPFTCEGEPMSNLPHDSTPFPENFVDASQERLPGGMAGNGQDTNDNAKDFRTLKPSAPQNLVSPVTPP